MHGIFQKVFTFGFTTLFCQFKCHFISTRFNTVISKLEILDQVRCIFLVFLIEVTTWIVFASGIIRSIAAPNGSNNFFLKRKCYFTANRDNYLFLVSSLYRCHRYYSFSVLSRSAPCGAPSRCGWSAIRAFRLLLQG